jgi:Flp pilus assembly protein TadG
MSKIERSGCAHHPTKEAQRATIRLARNEQGVVAVEFALVLPLVLTLYLGLVEFSQGYRISEKVNLLAHTLADLTAQQLNAPTGVTGVANGQAAIDEPTIQSIFSAAKPLMAPISAANVRMTISEVYISGIPAAAPTSWQAKVYWTIALNSGALRGPCGQDYSSSIPASYTKPQTVTINGASANVNPSVGAVIIADVAYDYKPGFSFAAFNWSAKPTFTMQRTSYAPVRNTYSPNHILYYMTSGTNCNAPTP